MLVLENLGFCVFPMMLLIFFVRKSFFEALNPGLVLGGIARAGREYWIVVAMWWVMSLVWAVLAQVTGSVPLLGFFLFSGTGIYFLMAAGRALGLVYQSRAEQLGWY